MTMRQLVYEMLAVDTQLNGLGVNAETLYANWTPDSPAANQQRFMVLRWGVVDAGIGPVRSQLLTVWMYDRERTYATIVQALTRVRTLLENLIGVAAYGVSVLGAEWSFSSEDLYDDVYGAMARSETYRLVASGV